jgi:hypothetical protein
MTLLVSTVVNDAVSRCSIGSRDTKGILDASAALSGASATGNKTSAGERDRELVGGDRMRIELRQDQQPSIHGQPTAVKRRRVFSTAGRRRQARVHVLCARPQMF